MQGGRPTGREKRDSRVARWFAPPKTAASNRWVPLAHALLSFRARRVLAKKVLLDCQACGGPLPAGAGCPHCDVGPKARSLRGWLRVLSLVLTLPACILTSNSYGAPPCDPNHFSESGFTCHCEEGFCSPQCDPATFVSPQGSREVCDCDDGGFCEVGTLCNPATVLPDSGYQCSCSGASCNETCDPFTWAQSPGFGCTCDPLNGCTTVACDAGVCANTVDGGVVFTPDGG